MPHIEVENLTVRYPGRGIAALLGVSFTVEPGETVLILGPSGSGKSTLTHCLNGLIPRSINAEMTGAVYVDGQDTRETHPGHLSRKVGLVFQNPEAQFVTLTVADEVAFGLESLAVPPAQMEARIDEALGDVGLFHARARRLDQLSEGEKQRLTLACALAMAPSTLVLDEPTALLDPEGTNQVYRALDHLPGQTTLILVEHKLDACILMVDRVLLLNPEGRLVGDGPPREVLFHYRKAINDWGIWLPQVTEAALHLERDLDDEVPLRLDEGVQMFKKRLPLVAPTPEEPAGTPPMHAPGARAFVINKLSHAQPGTDTKILDDVSLSVPVGDFLALLGPNGSGKSTLAAYLTGLHKPEPGKVTLFGFDVNDLSTTDIVERTGYVSQNPERQFLTNRVTDELIHSLRARTRAPRGRLPGAVVEARVRELVELMTLEGLEAANPYALSEGQKRRLSLALTLAAGHRLLVLDEPTYGLDRRATRRLIHILRDLNRGGVTIVLITQDMRLAASATRNTALLIDGKLAYRGSTRDLFYQDVLLIQAGLWPPPLFDLTLELQRWQADFPNLMTVDDYVAAFQGQSA